MNLFLQHNINDMCKIRLTETGKQILAAERFRLKAFAPNLDWDELWKEDAEGYLQLQLWCVMELFGGQNIVFGKEPPMEPTFLMMEPSCVSR